ncbi:MAG: BCCT family transporter, partial [Chromatocurvus sp.]
YFAFSHGLPLTWRSAFYPLVGERIYGPFGATVDVFAIVCTTCGVATSLGLGVLQINGGLNYLFGVEISAGVQVLLIICTMALATVSVVLGLDAGIKRLSELNIGLSMLLLLGVLLAGPTVVILQGTVENFGTYIGDLVTNTFNLYAYKPTDWLGGWTIFYWGWWLSWSPFVGLFIARISRGRTIREFVLGAMLVPCGFTLLWMGVFGNSAIELILHGGATKLGAAVQENQSVALFSFLEYLPMTPLLSGISLLMVVVFFVTSADSGAMVLNMLCANGRDDTPAPQRMFWTALIALIAIALLLAGGLSSLQTAAIASALPFSVALLGAMWGFSSALRDDVAKRTTQTVTPYVNQPGDWRQRLTTLLHYPGEATVRKFMATTVTRAMQDFAAELAAHDVKARVVDELEQNGSLHLDALHGDEIDFVYRVRCRPHPMPSAGIAAESIEELGEEDRFYRAEVHLKEGGQDYCVMGWTAEQINHDMLSQYQTHLQFLHSLR